MFIISGEDEFLNGLYYLFLCMFVVRMHICLHKHNNNKKNFSFRDRGFRFKFRHRNSFTASRKVHWNRKFSNLTEFRFHCKRRSFNKKKTPSVWRRMYFISNQRQFKQNTTSDQTNDTKSSHTSATIVARMRSKNGQNTSELWKRKRKEREQKWKMKPLFVFSFFFFFSPLFLFIFFATFHRAISSFICRISSCVTAFN